MRQYQTLKRQFEAYKQGGAGLPCSVILHIAIHLLIAPQPMLGGP